MKKHTTTYASFREKLFCIIILRMFMAFVATVNLYEKIHDLFMGRIVPELHEHRKEKKLRKMKESDDPYPYHQM